jgi:hypothetical protein
MKMLSVDEEYFYRAFPSAVAFILAASLRKELYGLLRTADLGRSEGERKRIEELKHAPACQEPWFIRKLEDEKLAAE